jgi:hypothetical protein
MIAPANCFKYLYKESFIPLGALNDSAFDVGQAKRIAEDYNNTDLKL